MISSVRRHVLQRTAVAVLLLVTVLTLMPTQALAQNTQTKAGENIESAKLQLLLDRQDIIAAVNAVGITADRKDWQGCRALFTDQVDIDYTSLAGGKPSTVQADGLIDSWRKALGGFTSTQHAITNHQVTVKSDEADSFSYVHAMHYLPNTKGSDYWVVYGYYDRKLIRVAGSWKVKAMKFTVTYADGNQQLFHLATEAMKK
jgi:hypothetical protein